MVGVGKVSLRVCKRTERTDECRIVTGGMFRRFLSFFIRVKRFLPGIRSKHTARQEEGEKAELWRDKFSIVKPQHHV